MFDDSDESLDGHPGKTLHDEYVAQHISEEY